MNMQLRWGQGSFSAPGALLALLALAPWMWAADAGEDKAVPPSQAVLDLLVPPGTNVSINGEDKGTRRSIRYEGFERGQLYPFDVRVQFRNGGTARRTVQLRGGWRVRLPLQDSTTSRPEIVLQTGQTQSVNSVAFSSDGRWLLTGSDDHTAILWDAVRGRSVRTYAGHATGVSEVSFGPEGKTISTLGLDSKIIVWDTQTGKQIETPSFTWEVAAKYFPQARSYAFSPDRKQVVMPAVQDPSGKAEEDNGAYLWEREGKELKKIIHRFDGHTARVTLVALSRDGRKLLTASKDNILILWDAQTHEKLRTLKGHTDTITSVDFSADGKGILSGSLDKTAILWDADTGNRLRTFEGEDASITSVAISADDKRVALGYQNGVTILADRRDGGNRLVLQKETRPVITVAFDSQRRRILSGTQGGAVFCWDLDNRRNPDFLDTHRVIYWGPSVAFSANRRQVLIGAKDNTATLWDIAGRKRLATLSGHLERVVAVAFSSDGQRAVTGSADKTAMLWDLQTHERLATLGGHQSYVAAAAFSPNGRLLLTASEQGGVILWNARTGAKLRDFAAPAAEDDPQGAARPMPLSWKAWTVAFTPDNDRFLIGTEDGMIFLVETDSGAVKRTFRGHSNLIHSLAFSSDGRYLVSGSCDRTAILWDFRTGKPLRTFAHTHCVHSAELGPDDRTVITGSIDGAIHLWDVASGDELARLIGLANGRDWLVVTPEGLFDASEAGRLNVSYRVGGGLNVVPLDRFSQDFYHPGLLVSLMHGERPMPEVELAQSRAPSLRILSPRDGGFVEDSQVTLEAEAVDEGGGVQGPWLIHNGARLLDRSEPQILGKRVRRRFSVLLVEGENRLEVKAASRDGSWESEPAIITLRYAKPLPRPQLYLLAVGIDRYADDRLRLKFARADAQALADLFARRGKKSLYHDVHPHLLLDAKATRTAIRQQLHDIASQAKPQDTLLVFLAGHGTMIGQRYYFIPHEFQRGESTLEDAIRKQALAADVLGDYLAEVPALKRILILDTCASGGAVGLMSRKRNPFAFQRAIAALGRAQGVFTLAASAASEEAAEVPELGHGVLSYALLAGLNAVNEGPLKEQAIHPGSADRVASVLEWFNFASGQVPRLMRRYFGREQDVQMSSQGNSFPVLPVEDR